MTRTKRRSLIEISLFVASFFAIWSIRAIYLYSIDESIGSDAQRIVYSSLVKLILWGVPAFGFAYWVRHSSPFQYLGLTIWPTSRRWIFSLIVIGLFLGGVIAFETFLGRKELAIAGFSFSITISGLLFTFVSPLIEEIMFRGLLLNEYSSILPGWGANLLVSFLFVGIHLPFWLSHDGLNENVIANTVGVFIFSLVAGWLYLKSSSIWPPYLAHIANNWVASLLVFTNV